MTKNKIYSLDNMVVTFMTNDKKNYLSFRMCLLRVFSKGYCGVISVIDIWRQRDLGYKLCVYSLVFLTVY